MKFFWGNPFRALGSKGSRLRSLSSTLERSLSRLFRFRKTRKENTARSLRKEMLLLGTSFRSALKAFDLSKLLLPKITPSKQKSDEMFSQNRKHFCLRFSRVVALLLLLTSPTQAISMPKSCVKAADGWMKNPTAAVVTDTEFLLNIVDCLLSLGTNDEISHQLQNVIQKLPELIEKVLPVAKDKAGLLLSAYLAYKSYELHERAMNLETNVYKKHRHDFEVLQEKMRPVLNFINDQLILQWKSGDIASIQNIVIPLLQMLSRFSVDLKALNDAVHRDVTQGGSDKRRSFAYAAGLTTVCVGTMFFAGPAASGLTCLPSAVFVAGCIKSYNSLEETLSKLELLWETTAKRHKELAKFHASLELIAVTGQAGNLENLLRLEGISTNYTMHPSIEIRAG